LAFGGFRYKYNDEENRRYKKPDFTWNVDTRLTIKKESKKMNILTAILAVLLKISALFFILNAIRHNANANPYVLYERFDKDPLDAMPAIESSDLLKRFLATTRSPAQFDTDLCKN